MKKVRDNRGGAVVCWGVLARQESAKKTRKWRYLLLPLVCVLVLGVASTSFAEITCGTPSSCVVIIDNYYQVPYLGRAMINTFTGVDHSCSNLGLVFGEILSLKSFYWHTLSKWYWNGTCWVQITGLYGFTPSAASDADYANDTGTRYGQWLYPQTLFPKGCSDLPSQQPDQAPNSDPGRPECNDQGL